MPVSLGAYNHCDGTPIAVACTHFANSNWSAPWGLPAMVGFPFPWADSYAAVAVSALAFTVVCHWAIRRFLPSAVPIWGVGLFVVLWTVAGMAIFFAWLGGQLLHHWLTR